MPLTHGDPFVAKPGAPSFESPIIAPNNFLLGLLGWRVFGCILQE